ncbi:hypothetical protein EV128_11672 [Rhizobium azibense]|nr:hypothetical protein EV128_11672 [Rhizobium azibense]
MGVEEASSQAAAPESSRFKRRHRHGRSADRPRLPSRRSTPLHGHDGQPPPAPKLYRYQRWLPLASMVDAWGALCDGYTGGRNDITQTRKALHQKVKALHWSPGWLPLFASAEGDHYCVDLSPGPSGDVGQAASLMDWSPVDGGWSRITTVSATEPEAAFGRRHPSPSRLHPNVRTASQSTLKPAEKSYRKIIIFGESNKAELNLYK